MRQLTGQYFTSAGKPWKVVAAMAKAIREAYGKETLSRYLQTLSSSEQLSFPVQAATVTPRTDFGQLAKDNPWLETEVRMLGGCSLGTWGRVPTSQAQSLPPEEIIGC